MASTQAPPAQPPSPTQSTRSVQSANPSGRQPGLNAAPDDHDSLYGDYYTQPLEPPPPMGANGLMRHANRSVPSLPASQQGRDESAPPLPNQPYDPTQLLDRFTAMHVRDPIQRGTSAMSYRTTNTMHSYASEPIPRAGTSMSVRSAQGPPGPYPPRGLSLPVSPAQGRPQGGFQGYPPDGSTSDAASFHSARTQSIKEEDGEEGGLAYDQPGDGSDRTSSYSQNSGNYSYYAPDPQQQQWQQPPGYAYPGAQGQWGPPPGPPGPQDPYYAAAPGMYGMGPPPGAPPMHGGYAQPPYQRSPYAQSVRSFQSSASAPSMAPPQGPYPGGGYPAPGPRPLSDPSMGAGEEEEEFARRPPMERQGTTASVAPSTTKTKAVDLAAPPYTKQYVDEYRQRIKADPDPEAHFAYAKYLVDASKKVGGEQAKDSRALKKYRETLAQEALKVIRRLATQGEPYDEAQFYLANCYGTGNLGLQVDHERAYHLYLQAAKQNHAAAAYRVAVCNEIGAGTRKEPARAAAFYRKAASLGDTAAMYKLGVVLLRGLLGEARNPRDAVGWLKRAAEQADEANPHALHELALLHESQDGLVPYDPLYAKRLLTQAAQLGYTHSQFKLGQMYEQGSAACAQDPKRSIAWYTKAAEKGHPEAELALSGWYLTGVEGVLKQSDSEAYLWARRAANKGLAKAEYAVGYYAEVGIGIKQDTEFAKRWYMRAATQGNKRAMNRLTEMKRGGKQGSQSRPTRQQATDACIIA